LRFTVDDNGVGMCEEALVSLQNELDHASTRENESYGLRNLHQRLRLYYGKGYGLSVFRNDYGGLSVSILVARSDSRVRPDASPRFFNTSSE
jgi:two-component system sensor histidine kinase YesM